MSHFNLNYCLPLSAIQNILQLFIILLFNFRHAPSMENAGLGQCRPDDIKADDDEYEAYRKRMMLAYRFRPNPLVSLLL